MPPLPTSGGVVSGAAACYASLEVGRDGDEEAAAAWQPQQGPMMSRTPSGVLSPPDRNGPSQIRASRPPIGRGGEPIDRASVDD